MNFKKLLFVSIIYCLASNVSHIRAHTDKTLVEHSMRPQLNRAVCIIDKPCGFNALTVSLVGAIVLTKIARIIGLVGLDYSSMRYLSASPAPPSPALR